MVDRRRVQPDIYARLGVPPPIDPTPVESLPSGGMDLDWINQLLAQLRGQLSDPNNLPGKALERLLSSAGQGIGQAAQGLGSMDPAISPLHMPGALVRQITTTPGGDREPPYPPGFEQGQPPLPTAPPPSPPSPLAGPGGPGGGPLGLTGPNPLGGGGTAAPPGGPGLPGQPSGPGGPSPYTGQDAYMQDNPMDYVVNMLRDRGVTDPYANPFARANMERFNEPTVQALFSMWQALNENGMMEQFLPQFMSGQVNPASLIQQIAAAAQSNPDLLSGFQPEEFAAIQERARGSSPRNAAVRQRALAKRAAEQRQAALRTEQGRNQYLDTDWIKLLSGGR